jgi:uncharacterized membrane protein YfcA
VTELLLLIAGFIAGTINSLAGGGSFIAFPALLFAGVPPVLANASNTYAALPGYISGFVGYWPSVRAERSRLLVYAIVALIFGYLGAELLLRVSDDQFQSIVPVLIGFGVVLFAFGDRINKWVASRAKAAGGSKTAGSIALLAVLAAVCFYGGFFNAGFGILLLAFLALAGLTDIHAMNGLKLWISSVASSVAVLRFILAGSIDWYFGTITLVGVVIGGYTAARLAPLIPQRVLRISIIVYGVVLTGYFAWLAWIA